MQSEIRLALEFLAGSLFSAYVLINLKIDSGVATILTLVGGVVAIFICEFRRSKQQAAGIIYLSYNKKTKELTVKARNPQSANVIKVKEIVDYNLNYHPSKIVYTGATVGGIHTGGFHDAGNYYTMDGSSTKKYHLIYEGIGVSPEDYCPINSIKLDASLIDEAKKNAVIRQYLRSNGTLTLSNTVNSKYSEQIDTAVQQGKTDLAIQMAKLDYYNKQLSKEQCDAVKNWICSINSL